MSSSCCNSSKELSKEDAERILGAISRNDNQVVADLAETAKEKMMNFRIAGSTLLHLAAREGKSEICSTLLRIGFDVDEPGIDIALGIINGSTPLERAAAGGDLATVRVLINHGAQPNGSPSSVTTPLIYASMEGHADVARFLLNAGAQVNHKHLRLPRTALDFAMLYKHSAVENILREHGGLRFENL